MKIKSVHLQNYKRFVELTIADIPETTRLVVLIGPNGSGKSSLFDAFLLKSWPPNNNHLTSSQGAYGGYYNRSPDGPQFTSEIAKTVNVQVHSQVALAAGEWAAAFNIRSAYRNESDFRLQSIEPVQSSHQSLRFTRIIDADQSVADNYKRLTWKRQADVDSDAEEDMTIGQYREEFLSDLQTAMRDLFTDPPLSLQDFGGVEDAGTFRFSKGTTVDFHYKNLSGGEKAAFDLLLDIFVKRDEYKDAIYCIDEPETHIAPALQGPLLKAMLDLVPDESQLWIATHSIGFVRYAYELMKSESNVVFLDFGEDDFDKPVAIRPRVPNRSFWQTTYTVALDDLADLIAPQSVIICEGNKALADKGFDAECYNRLFPDTHSDTLFISYGSSGEVERSQHLMSVLGAVAKGITVWRLIDRDDMDPEERTATIQDGVCVLRRRELENYLYDPEVLRTFLRRNEKQDLADDILNKRKELLGSAAMPDNVKAITQELFEYIKTKTGIASLGKQRRRFALSQLVPALRETPSVFQELREDVFPQE